MKYIFWQTKKLIKVSTRIKIDSDWPNKTKTEFYPKFPCVEMGKAIVFIYCVKVLPSTEITLQFTHSIVEKLFFQYELIELQWLFVSVLPLVYNLKPKNIHFFTFLYWNVNSLCIIFWSLFVWYLKHVWFYNTSNMKFYWDQ